MAKTPGTTSQAASKTAWRSAAKQDRGPHLATLPSGVTVRFVVPDSAALLRAGKLPDRLRRTALICAAHPEGVDGYMADLAYRALAQGALEDTAAQAVEESLEMGAWLVSEMVVEPKVTPEEVASGEFPELDVRMLLDFAERKIDTDSAGRKLPIVTLESVATFRPGTVWPEGGGDGSTAADNGDGAVPDADGDTV